MLLTASALLLTPSLTLAYSPADAAGYADQWATSSSWCNSHLCFSGDDCTNFVSYALHYGGGYQLVYGNGSNTDDHNWWFSGGWPYQYTHSWSVAQDQYLFQLWHYPGGWVAGTVTGSDAYSGDGLAAGDLVFYDWDSSGSMDHVAIQATTAYVTDPVSGWYGNSVDAHSNNHYHAFWSLLPYNSKYRTTTIKLVSLSTGN